MKARMQQEMLMKMRTGAAFQNGCPIERPWGITTRVAASDLHFKFALLQKICNVKESGEMYRMYADTRILAQVAHLINVVVFGLSFPSVWFCSVLFPGA